MKKLLVFALLFSLLGLGLPAQKPARTMVGAASGALKVDLDDIIARGNHVLNIIDWGAGTGMSAAVNTAAINAAIADMTALGGTGDWLLIPSGTFMVTPGIEFDPPSTCGLICYGILSAVPSTTPVVTIGDATGATARSEYTVKGLRVIGNNSLGTLYPWITDSVGVRVINTVFSNIQIEHIADFWSGLQVTGTDGNLTMGNSFWINKIMDCYRHVHLETNLGGAGGGLGLVEDNRFFNANLVASTLDDKLAFTVFFEAVGETCTMDIVAGASLVTTPSGGSTAFNLNLTLSANDTIGEVIDLINADAAYTCLIGANAERHWPSILLTAVAAQDISTATYSTMIDGEAGNVAVYLEHDGVNPVTRNFFDNFFFDAGANGQSIFSDSQSAYFRHAMFGSLSGPIQLGANSISNVLEIPSLPPATFVTDGGTTNRVQWYDVVPRAVATATLGSVAATGNAYVFTTNRPVYIERIDLVSSTGIATSDTDYWSLQARNVTGAVNLLAAARTTETTGGFVVTADTIWSITPTQNQTLAAGDVLQLQFVKTLAPSAWSSTFVVVHYRVAE